MGATMKPSYKDAKAFLGGDVVRKLGHETSVGTRSADGIAVTLYRTDIIIYYPDGSIRLDTGGWRSRLTKDRLNECSPFHVYSERGEWAIVHRLDRDSRDRARFQDGIFWEPRTGFNAHKAWCFEHKRRAARRMAERERSRKLHEQEMRALARQQWLESQTEEVDLLEFGL